MKKGIIGGIVLILLGIYLIFSNFLEINWNYFWPVILLIIGFKFEYNYFKYKNNPGVLVPGGILITLGIIFYLSVFLGYDSMRFLWPGFILAPAIGIAQMSIVTKRIKENIFPIVFLSGLSIIFFVEEIIGINIWNYIIGLLFIAIGINILIKRSENDE
ncbi:hypothetical protein [Marinitoga sp. 38H-ov]|uniref:LiaI-LiaF-like domain-containing protein n=1 Tax=Marinitoga sp. 38H-ov TaxID=1755814 RepID=UPI0013EB97C5|nr:hypothetical protein [Marinitoga sp. 38H-ov]KAF2956962.1 hypothetical protein AS160_02960 [Marinitoga sp. 38H-ov]